MRFRPCSAVAIIVPWLNCIEWGQRHHIAIQYADNRSTDEFQLDQVNRYRNSGGS